MPEHPDTLIWVAGVKPSLAVNFKKSTHCLYEQQDLTGDSL